MLNILNYWLKTFNALIISGLDKSAAKSAGEIDSFEPITGEDFTKFAGLLTTKIENYKVCFFVSCV